MRMHLFHHLSVRHGVPCTLLAPSWRRDMFATTSNTVIDSVSYNIVITSTV
jgi:hypothetical protein